MKERSMKTVDCPCGYGKNIGPDQKTCPACGTDLTPLHRLKALPGLYYREGLERAGAGDGDGALEKLATALSLDPDNPEYAIALGEVYAGRGMLDEAERLYHKALSLEPDSRDTQAAIDKLRDTREAESKERKRTRFRRLSLAVSLPIAALVIGVLVVLVPQWASEDRPPADGSGTAAVDLPALCENIEDELLGAPSLEGSLIQVDRAGSGISISGQVPSEVHKSLVEEIAANEAQGIDVDLRALTVAAEPEGPETVTYTVKAGDSLCGIAFEFYGDHQMWRKVFAANWEDIEDPDIILVGQNLVIPAE